MFIQFGSGLLFLNPNAGNLATNPTPVRPFTLQDVKIDSKGKIEELKGQNQYPDDTAVGDRSGTFEFSMGRQDYFLLNQIVNADVQAAGGNSVTLTPATAIPTTPFQITPTVPGSGTFLKDLGVVNAANNQPFERLASGTPGAGQYTVAAGVYTFSSADNVSGISVIIAFAYSLVSTGATFEVNNQLQGYGPSFEAFLVDTYQPQSGVYSAVRLYAAKISDVSKDNKRSGYSMLALKGSFYAAPSGRVIDLYSNVGANG